MRLWFIGILILTLQACVNLPKCTPASNMSPNSSAKIVVYRERALIGFASTQAIGLNECLLGTLKNGSYLLYSAPAGRHNVLLFNDIGQQVSELMIDVATGREYFVRYYSNVDSIVWIGANATVTGNEGLVPVPKEQAISELEDLKNI